MSLTELDVDEYVPMSGHRRSDSNTVRLRRLPSNTLSAWLLALAPLVGLAVNFGLAIPQSGTTTQTNLLLVSVALLLWTLLLALSDRRRLRAAGHERTASPWLVLLTPLVFLVVRGVMVHRATWSGLGPIWTHLAALVAVPGILVVAGVAGALLSQLRTASGM